MAKFTKGWQKLCRLRRKFNSLGSAIYWMFHSDKVKCNTKENRQWRTGSRFSKVGDSITNNTAATFTLTTVFDYLVQVTGSFLFCFMKHDIFQSDEVVKISGSHMVFNT